MPPRISVLIVDDEPQLLELAKLYLERTGEVATTVAQSANEAASLLVEREFDAIICDYQMPSKDGLQFLKDLRGEGNDIPFILFTGKGREDVAIEALNSGADFYLQKGGDPVSQFAELTNMVRSSVAALRSKKELARSEERFRLLAENSEDMIYRFVVLPEPHFEYVSPASERIFGWTPEDHYSNPALATEIVHPEDRHYMDELVEGTLDTSEPLKIRGLRKDGSKVWIELRLVDYRDDEGRLVAIEGTVLDIDKRVKAEQELKESEARYRSIFETAGSGMVIIDENDTILLANSEFERMSGYSKKELQGKIKWTAFVDPEDLPSLRSYREEQTKDPMSGPATYQLTTRDRFGSEQHILANAVQVPGTTEIIVSVVDETDRRRYEDAIQQASKKIDLLARITRHDILNQLAALYGYLDLARERIEDPGHRGLIEKAIVASESIRRHLEFARDYQNMGTKRPQWIDVQAACKRASSNIELKGVTVSAEIGDLEIFSDQMLEKVFYNLIDNSLKHGKKTARVMFRYSHGPDGIHLVYEDDGVGVPQEDKESIFERSMGDRDGRRGYGLYLAREILSITGITIRETGTPGEGARFELTVPRGRYRSKMETEARGRVKRRRY
jgi:PAS domain S-box-containing protein